MLRELIEVVSAEFRRAASETPSAKEVERSKAQLKAGMLMGLESSGARAEQMARQMIVHDRLIGFDELIARVEAVTPQVCRDIAEKIVGASVPSIAIVGAGTKGTEYLDLASRLMPA
jgi:predicted Zn-dependent peptidase